SRPSVVIQTGRLPSNVLRKAPHIRDGLHSTHRADLVSRCSARSTNLCRVSHSRRTLRYSRTRRRSSTTPSKQSDCLLLPAEGCSVDAPV
ncbi:hypothetical protein PoB_001554000, partial [Plakobranchus ocellatus]